LRYYDANTDGNVVEHFTLQDANFNVTAVTDNAGTVVERYAYTPYGEATELEADFSADAVNKSDIDNELLYTGRRLDPETGLQLNRNRFYASHLGRWVNRDPIGYEGSKWNLYEYVGGMPLKYWDPSGLAWWPPSTWPIFNPPPAAPVDPALPRLNKARGAFKSKKMQCCFLEVAFRAAMRAGRRNEAAAIQDAMILNSCK